MGCLSLLQVIVQLIVCIKLIASQSGGTSITFRSVKQNATVVGVEPFYNQTTFSITECYLACLQQLERCCFIEVANVNEAWSCKLFHYYEEDIEKHLKPSQGSDVSAPKLPQDCVELKKLGFKDDGVYFIRNKKAGNVNKKVFCDMTTDGGGWIVIQRRFDGSVSFYRDWNTYKDGFGDAYGEQWLGNEFVHQYTNAYPTEMMAEAVAFDGAKIATKFQNFELSDEASSYTLRYDTCENMKGDEDHCFDWIRSNGAKFSTIDKDSDTSSNSCAVEFSGAWWSVSCHDISLNGNYSTVERIQNRATRIHWKTFRGFLDSLLETKMVIRRAH